MTALDPKSLAIPICYSCAGTGYVQGSEKLCYCVTCKRCGVLTDAPWRDQGRTCADCEVQP